MLKFNTGSSRRLMSSAAVALAFCGSYAAPAFAQQSAPAPTPQAAEPASDGSNSPEIVVTAERRSTSQFASTTSVAVLSNADLRDRQITNLDTLQYAVPSLSVSNAGVANLVNIRGVGRTEVQINDAAGVQIYRDGVPTFNGYFSGAEPYFDVQSIEVLKGPQGTFAGQNSTGGAIFIKSADPDLTKVGGFVQVQGGSFGDAGLMGALNVPLSSTFGIRVAIDGERRGDPYIYSGTYTGHPGRMTLGAARFSALWQPSSSFSAKLKVDLDYNDQGASTYAPATSTDDLFRIKSNAPLKAVDQFYRVSGFLNYTFQSGVSLQSITGYQKGKTENFSDQDGTDVGSNTLQYNARESIFSQELDLVSPNTGPFRYTVGAFYTRDNLEIPNLVAAVPPVSVVLTAKYRTSANVAAFGNFTYEITPAFQVEIGARYNHANQKQDILTTVFFGTIPLSQIVAQPRLPDDNSVTGKFSLSYRFDPQNFAYAFVARGHKNSGLNTDPTVPNYAGEDLTDFEIGYRHFMFGNKLKLQLSGYYYDYKNYQFIRTDETTRTSALLNVPGHSSSYGVEAQLDGHFGGTTLNLAASYADSSLATFYAVDPRNPAPAASAACVPGGPSTSAQCLNLTGKRLPYSPRWSLSGGLSHSFDTGIGAIKPRIDVIYTDRQLTTVFATAGDHLAARTVVNGEIDLLTGDWTFTAYATNLFNEKYVVATTGGLRVPSMPAQFGARILRRF